MLVSLPYNTLQEKIGFSYEKALFALGQIAFFIGESSFCSKGVVDLQSGCQQAALALPRSCGLRSTLSSAASGSEWHPKKAFKKG